MRFMSSGARSWFAFGLVPVPIETTSISSRPVGHWSAYGSIVAMRNRRKAGLLYIVTPPSTMRNGLDPPASTASGGKYVGAAVDARTSCQSGRSRLQARPVSRRDARLYFAFGLFESGHGESVVAL